MSKEGRSVSTMDEICEVLYSQKGNHKIKVRGYLMIKERNRKNIFYWCCAKTKSFNCRGRVTTVFWDQKHFLKKFVNHNHKVGGKPEPKVNKELQDIVIVQADDNLNAPTNNVLQTNDVLTYDDFASSSLNTNIKIESDVEIHQESVGWSDISDDGSIPQNKESDYIPPNTLPPQTEENCAAATDVPPATQVPNLSANTSYIKSLCNILECEMLQTPADIIEECKDEVINLIIRIRSKAQNRKDADKTI